MENMEAAREPKFVKNTPQDPSRLIGLSDGVFATVLTLLVLDLRVPEIFNARAGDVNDILSAIGPHLFSYLMTFLVAGSYWLSHHRNFDRIVGYDRRLLSYNLLLLLFIGLLPFSTALISLDQSQSTNYSFFWAMYATDIALAGIMQTLVWNYAFSHHFVLPETSRTINWNFTLRGLIIPIVFMLSIAAEYLLRGSMSLYLLLSIPVFSRIIDHFFHPETETSFQPSGWREFLWQSGTTLIWLILIGFAIWSSKLQG